MTGYRYHAQTFFLMAICWCISSSTQPDLKKYHFPADSWSIPLLHKASNG